MDDASKLAFQFGLELAKQLITLSTAIIGVTVTFTKDIVKTSPARWARWTLSVSWLCYLGSIWYGVSHIMSLTGGLEVAALERAALPDTAGTRSERELAALYLDPDADSAKSEAALEQLKARGVMIGTDAKSAAKRQIQLFFTATTLAIVYGALVFQAKEKPRQPYVAE